MKKLKLLLIPFLFLSLFSTSCNNDDDGGAGDSNADPIVGTWKITDIWVNGQSVYAILMVTDPCPLETKFIFENDFTARVEPYQSDAGSGDCVAGEVQNGSWSKEGSVYYISAEGQTANSEVEFLDDNNFTVMYEFEGQPAKVKLTRQ